VSEPAPILDVRGLWAGYGDTIVVRDMDLTAEVGKTVVMIGPNGHGKTTFLRAVSGLIKPARGEVRLAGGRVDGRSPDSIARMGLVHVMQGDGLFSDMTVEENLLMGAFPTASWGARRAALDRVYDLFPQISDRHGQRARTLSGGERRLVGLGRGLMRDARILLIDEPSLGLAPVMIDTVYGAIREIRERLGTAILLVEENFSHIGGVADVVHVVEMGGIVRSGSLEELASDRTVVETYLGSL
jgi:branched-chain amino acid transport system ATP-binding protein